MLPRALPNATAAHATAQAPTQASTQTHGETIAGRWMVAWLPAPDSPLARCGLSWCQGSKGLLNAVTWPREFHAVLKESMRLRAMQQEPDLVAAARRLAAHTRPFPLPPLQVALCRDRLVLQPDRPVDAHHPLRVLADRCVRELDTFRAPLSLIERAKRLTPSHRRSLDKEQHLLDERWGSGEVFHRWRFHLRLGEGLPQTLRPAALKAALQHFGTTPWRDLQAQGLAVLRQTGPFKPWTVVAHLPFGACASTATGTA